MDNDNNFKVSFDADSDIVVINDKIKTRGAISYSIKKVKEKDPDYDIEYEVLKIEGVLATEYYTKDITKIETKRLIINDIDVYSEEFGSKEDIVIYKFNANFARVKYQTTDYIKI